MIALHYASTITSKRGSKFVWIIVLMAIFVNSKMIIERKSSIINPRVHDKYPDIKQGLIRMHLQTALLQSLALVTKLVHGDWALIVKSFSSSKPANRGKNVYIYIYRKV